MFAIWDFYLLSPGMFTFQKHLKYYKYLYHLAAGMETMLYTMVHLDKAASQGMEIKILNYSINKSELNCLSTSTESQSFDCNILTAKAAHTASASWWQNKVKW